MRQSILVREEAKVTRWLASQIDNFSDWVQQLADELATIHRHPATYWDLEVVLDCHPDVDYYPPWHDFGLGGIPPSDLRSRADSHLRRIMIRI